MDYSSARPRVVVIGAGIVGASIAFHISRRDAELTVIDRAQPGEGASGHSFAWVNSFEKEPAHYHDLNRRSQDMWERFIRRLDADVGVQWGGELRWVTNEDDAETLRQRVALLQSRGYVTRLVGEEEMRRLEPDLNLGDFAIGELSANDCHVDPPKVVRACLEHARAGGASMYADIQVVGFVVDGQGDAARVKAVRTSQGDVPCDAVVLSAGLGTTELAAMVGLSIPQQDSPGVVVRTTPCPRLLRTAAVLHTPPVGPERQEVHMRQYADGSVMIGEGSQESLARDDSQEHADELVARAAHYLPGLSGAKAIPVPVGYRPMPVDGLPILGFTRAVPNLYIALMHSGVTLAPLVGELAAIEVLDGTRVEMLEPYRLERFD